MKFSLTRQIWKKERPRCANGSGVSKALKLLDSAAKKKTAQLTLKEIQPARVAITAAETAMGTARNKINKDKNKSKNAAFLKKVGVWEGEYSKKLVKLNVHEYGLQVASVQEAYNNSYGSIRDTFDKSYGAAQVAEQKWKADPTVLPTAAELQKWMGSLRDMNKMASKQGVLGLSTDFIKTIKFTDLAMSPDKNNKKNEAKTLWVQCEAFAKAIKKGTKDIGASLGDIKKVEKDLKSLLTSYTVILKKNKVMITQAKRLAIDAKAEAGIIKKLVLGEKTTPIDNPAGVAANMKALNNGLNELRDDNIALHKPYRESTGALAKAGKKLRDLEGYDAAKHGKIVTTAQSNLQVAIRQVTLSLASGDRQIERCKKYMTASNTLRGYA